MNGNEKEYKNLILRICNVLKDAITEYVSLRYEEWNLNETVENYLQHFSEESEEEKIEGIESVVYDEIEDYIKQEQEKLNKININEIFNVCFGYKDIKDIVDGFYIPQVLRDIESEVISEPYEDYNNHEEYFDEVKEIKNMFERNVEY